MSGAAPAVNSQAAVSGGSFGLSPPAAVPAQAALTLQTTGTAGFSVTGYDFRSGALPNPVPGQLRCELVVCPKLVVSGERLQEWATSFVAVTQQVSAPAVQLPVTVTVSSISVALAPNVVTVTAMGEVSGAIGQSPFSASLPLTITPSGSPKADEIAVVSFAGSGPTVNFLAPPGPQQQVFSLVGSFVQPLLGQLLQDSLHSWAQPLLLELVTLALALPTLPPSTTVTLRSLAIDEAGITLQPVLGTIGTGLSTFKPAPLPVPAAP